MALPSYQQYLQDWQSSQKATSAGSDVLNQGRALDVELKKIELDKAKQEQTAGYGSDQTGNALLNDITSAKDKVTATGEAGKATREQLIGLLSTKYAKALKPSEIAASVYQIIRGKDEPGYTGVDQAPQFAEQKAPTDTQRSVAGYASRVENSGKIINGLTPYLTKLSPTALAAYSSIADKPILRSVAPTEVQQAVQAQRDFLTAVLRRESGAVISPSEFSDARLQYFPQPGDSPEVIKQKETNRAIVLKNLVKASGSAYSPLYPEDSSQSSGGSSGGSTADPLGIF